MSTGNLLSIHPPELKFAFELKVQSSCSMHLSNKTDKHVAFKVKTTNPRNYRVRPNWGIVLPEATCDVTVTMQDQRDAPSDMQCGDKFLLESVAAPEGATTKDITPEMEEGKVFECVWYTTIHPCTPEKSEEGSSPQSYSVENGNLYMPLLGAVSRSSVEPKQKLTDILVRKAWSVISMLTGEKLAALQQN